MSDPDLSRKGIEASNTVLDVPHAPFLFFENAPTFGTANGVFFVTLTANRHLPGPDNQVKIDTLAVAHLRGNRHALEALRSAIDGAILLATQSEGEVQ